MHTDMENKRGKANVAPATLNAYINVIMLRFYKIKLIYIKYQQLGIFDIFSDKLNALIFFSIWYKTIFSQHKKNFLSVNKVHKHLK